MGWRWTTIRCGRSDPAGRALHRSWLAGIGADLTRTLAADVLAVTGTEAIVDWVVLELRMPSILRRSWQAPGPWSGATDR